MEEVKSNEEIFFLFLNLDKALRDSNPCILQSKWFEMIATKFDKTRIPFLSDVFSALHALVVLASWGT